MCQTLDRLKVQSKVLLRELKAAIAEWKTDKVTDNLKTVIDAMTEIVTISNNTDTRIRTMGETKNERKLFAEVLWSNQARYVRVRDRDR